MKKLLLSLCLFGSLLGAAKAAEPNLDLFKQSIGPTAEIKSVNPSAINGIYEVLVNNSVFYITEDGEKVFSGELYDLKKGINYTQEVRNKLSLEALAKIKEEDTIIYPAKNEKYRVKVFTDITCPYCSKLHSHMKDFNDMGITIQYLAFPRAGLGSQPAKNMQKIWCAKDKAAALDAAKHNKTIPSEDCDGAQVVEQFLLGQDIGVNATPTLVFSNGEVLPGYLEPKRMLDVLQARFPEKTATATEAAKTEAAATAQ